MVPKGYYLLVTKASILIRESVHMNICLRKWNFERAGHVLPRYQWEPDEGVGIRTAGTGVVFWFGDIVSDTPSSSLKHILE